MESGNLHDQQSDSVDLSSKFNKVADLLREIFGEGVTIDVRDFLMGYNSVTGIRENDSDTFDYIIDELNAILDFKELFKDSFNLGFARNRNPFRNSGTCALIWDLITVNDIKYYTENLVFFGADVFKSGIRDKYEKYRIICDISRSCNMNGIIFTNVDNIEQLINQDKLVLSKVSNILRKLNLSRNLEVRVFLNLSKFSRTLDLLHCNVHDDAIDKVNLNIDKIIEIIPYIDNIVNDSYEIGYLEYLFKIQNFLGKEDVIVRFSDFFKNAIGNNVIFSLVKFNCDDDLLKNIDLIGSLNDSDYEFIGYLMTLGFEIDFNSIGTIKEISKQDRDILILNKTNINRIFARGFMYDLANASRGMELGNEKTAIDSQIGHYLSIFDKGLGGSLTLQKYSDKRTHIDVVTLNEVSSNDLNLDIKELLKVLDDPDLEDKLNLIERFRNFDPIDVYNKKYYKLDYVKLFLKLGNENIKLLNSILDSLDKYNLSDIKTWEKGIISDGIRSIISNICESILFPDRKSVSSLITLNYNLDNLKISDYPNLDGNDYKIKILFEILNKWDFLIDLNIFKNDNENIIYSALGTLGLIVSDDLKSGIKDRLIWIGLIDFNDKYDYFIDKLKLTSSEISDENRYILLYGYAYMSGDEDIESVGKEIFLEYFDKMSRKDFALKKIEGVLIKLLTKGRHELSSFENFLVNKLKDLGVGDLTYIDNVSKLISKFIGIETAQYSSNNELEKIHISLKNLYGELNKFLVNNSRLSDEEKNIFYCIFMDMIDASISTFSGDKLLFAIKYLESLNKLSQQQVKVVLDLMFKNLHVYMRLIDDTESDYDIKLDENVNIFKSFVDEILSGSDIYSITNKYNSIVEGKIKEFFVSRFGLKKLPENIDESHIRIIKNFATYSANIYYDDENYINEENDIMLRYCFALHLNGKWNEFRSGMYIDPAEYIDGDENCEIIRGYISNINEYNISIWGDQITQQEQDVLQGSEFLQMIGNIQTIDETLRSIHHNVMELNDLDVYKGDEKIILKLVMKYGKNTGSMLSLWYQIISQGDIINKSVKDKLHDMGMDEFVDDFMKEFEISGLEEVTKETIKLSQQILKNVTPIINYLDKIKGFEIFSQIKILDELKKPSAKIVEYFQRVGENFNTESGIIPISNDVNYLMNLIEKHADLFTQDELAEVNGYLDNVGAQIDKLYELKRGIDDLTTDLLKRFEKSGFKILKQRISAIKEEIDKDNNGRKSFYSHMTNDMNIVIENIRACLACNRKECNNDTNLSFVGFNKFFITSRLGSKGKGIADQLVTLFQSEQGPVFVMDLLYGERVLDIFINHILVVNKKMKKLGGKTKLFIPDMVYNYFGVNSEFIIELLQFHDEKLNIEEKNGYEVNVEDPFFGEGYYDIFGGRNVGPFHLNGILVS